MTMSTRIAWNKPWTLTISALSLAKQHMHSSRFADGSMLVSIITWDLNTSRHLATNFLMAQQIRLEAFALRLCETSRLVPEGISDIGITALSEVNPVPAPHRRNVVSPIQLLTAVGHDSIRLVPQRCPAHGPWGKVQSLIVLNGSRHLPRLVLFHIMSQFNGRNLWATRDPAFSKAVGIPSHVILHVALNIVSLLCKKTVKAVDWMYRRVSLLRQRHLENFSSFICLTCSVAQSWHVQVVLNLIPNKRSMATFLWNCQLSETQDSDVIDWKGSTHLTPL
jgi:hypothetical protein